MLDSCCRDNMGTFSGDEEGENSFRGGHAKHFRDTMLIAELGETKESRGIIPESTGDD